MLTRATVFEIGPNSHKKNHLSVVLSETKHGTLITPSGKSFRAIFLIIFQIFVSDVNVHLKSTNA